MEQEKMVEMYQSITDKPAFWERVCPGWPRRDCKDCENNGKDIYVESGMSISCTAAWKELERIAGVPFLYKLETSLKLEPKMLEEYIKEAHEVFCQEHDDYEEIIAAVVEMNR